MSEDIKQPKVKKQILEITISGPTNSGKSTICRILAAALADYDIEYKITDDSDEFAPLDDLIPVIQERAKVNLITYKTREYKAKQAIPAQVGHAVHAEAHPQGVVWHETILNDAEIAALEAFGNAAPQPIPVNLPAQNPEQIW